MPDRRASVFGKHHLQSLAAPGIAPSPTTSISLASMIRRVWQACDVCTRRSRRHRAALLFLGCDGYVAQRRGKRHDHSDLCSELIVRPRKAGVPTRMLDVGTRMSGDSARSRRRPSAGRILNFAARSLVRLLQFFPKITAPLCNKCGIGILPVNHSTPLLLLGPGGDYAQPWPDSSAQTRRSR